jgi:hypothetical protein
MPHALHSIPAVLLVLGGIILSMLLPLAVRTLRKATGLEGAEERAGGPPSFFDKLRAAWTRYGGNKYLIILLASTLVALVIVYLLGMKFFTAHDAILAGFAWESLLNKLKGG